MRINSDSIRASIKTSPFSFKDIAEMLEMSERSLYRHLREDTLEIKDINLLLKFGIVKIENILDKE